MTSWSKWRAEVREGRTWDVWKVVSYLSPWTPMRWAEHLIWGHLMTMALILHEQWRSTSTYLCQSSLCVLSTGMSWKGWKTAKNWNVECMSDKKKLSRKAAVTAGVSSDKLVKASSPEGRRRLWFWTCFREGRERNIHLWGSGGERGPHMNSSSASHSPCDADTHISSPQSKHVLKMSDKHFMLLQISTRNCNHGPFIRIKIQPKTRAGSCRNRMFKLIPKKMKTCYFQHLNTIASHRLDLQTCFQIIWRCSTCRSRSVKKAGTVLRDAYKRLKWYWHMALKMAVKHF